MVSYPNHRPHVGRVRAFFDCHFAVIQYGFHVIHSVTITGTAALLHHLINLVTLKTTSVSIQHYLTERKR